MTQVCGQNAQALFTYLRNGAGLNMTLSQPLTDDRDANFSDTNVFARDREITVTDADAGPALRTPPMQEIQYFIMRFMELLNGRNACAIDFLGESNRTCADTGIQGANFASSRGNKTHKSTTEPSPEHRREQPSGQKHSELVILNPDAVQAYNTFDSTNTRREHESDID
ncbi:MAG: hypothetical protein EZS28_010011 [Streblomastix strix]|uniref:Uncharacterized protein n=1 Tax=Streblomastix strix TaxID=222440 RepID=A0A5J4WI09_9EUKA|nr:MAG: hypothetical protein EZS28_010011 [Streblomastix strix]